MEMGKESQGRQNVHRLAVPNIVIVASNCAVVTNITVLVSHHYLALALY